MNKPKNYYFNLMVDSLTKQDKQNKKKLLLHSCCAPCNGWVVMMLSEYFDLTLYFNNSNIYPIAEYIRRLEELKSFVKKFDPNIEIVDNPYNAKYQMDYFDLRNVREGSERCFLCYERRMNEAYDYADRHNFDYFTTVMSISRQKNSQKLNEIGEKLSVSHQTKYFFSDFKKGGGMQMALDVSKQFAMYRQYYCGCIYSMKIPDNCTLDYLPNTNIFLYQRLDMFRVNTDTGLLGEYLPNLKNKKVLDIGCNNGALMLYAYYKDAKIVHGIDIQEEAIEIANKNMILHHFDNAVLSNISIVDYQDWFDIIVCNPPYFESSTHNDSHTRTKARHLVDISLIDLMKNIHRLLKDDGKAFLVYRYDLFNYLEKSINQSQLYIIEKQLAIDTRDAKYKSILVTLSKKNMEIKIKPDLIINKEVNNV